MRLLAVLGGHGAAAFLTLLRNLLAASLLSLEDYGLAATFLIVASLVEMLTQFGQSVLIVADRGGDGNAALARYHGFNLLRGLTGACGLALGALVFAPEHEQHLYLALALIPAFGAFQHYEQFQRQRSERSGIAVLIPALSAAISLAVLFALVPLMHDARAFLGALIAQAGAAFFLSHVLASEPFQLAFQRADLIRQFRQGLPLLANGALLYLVLFGERIIVGDTLGREALGLFAMGVTLTLTPSILLSKSLMTVYLPKLSRVRRTDGALATVKAHALAALALAVVVALAAPVFVSLALPSHFAALGVLLPLMAAQQSARLLKGAQAVVGIAIGRTLDEIAVSLLRILALPLALLAVRSGAGLETVVSIGLGGELAALVLALALVVWRLRAVPVQGAA